MTKLRIVVISLCFFLRKIEQDWHKCLGFSWWLPHVEIRPLVYQIQDIHFKIIFPIAENHFQLSVLIKTPSVAKGLKVGLNT